jgi:hypothetical protein
MKPKYTKKQEQNLFRRAERFRTIDEIRKANTRQGKFERAFLHYDWANDDFEQNHIFEVDNSSLALMGRQDFSLRSPSDIVQFKLDFEYYYNLLKRTNRKLHFVFRAVCCGFSWQDVGLPKRSWWNYFEKIENILARKQ